MIGDAAFAVYDVVEDRVDGVTAYEVVAVDIVLLAYAVGAVLALAAVGIGPWKFYESHVGRGGESQADAGGFD